MWFRKTRSCRLAAGRSLFRVPDLLELVQMVEEFVREACKGNHVMSVKRIMSALCPAQAC